MYPAPSSGCQLRAGQSQRTVHKALVSIPFPSSLLPPCNLPSPSSPRGLLSREHCIPERNTGCYLWEQYKQHWDAWLMASTTLQIFNFIKGNIDDLFLSRKSSISSDKHFEAEMHWESCARMHSNKFHFKMNEKKAIKCHMKVTAWRVTLVLKLGLRKF